MIPSYWYSPVAAFLWQLVLHSGVAGCIFYFWSRHLRLHSGRAKRWMLCTLLVLPVITALVPGRNSFAFREQGAWLDSTRILSLPLGDGIYVFHLMLGIGAITALVSILQEVAPALRRPRTDTADPPVELMRRARALPGWERCRVRVSPDAAIFLATAGRPSRPRLLLSRGTLDQLRDEELEAVLLHERAHWRRSRWLLAHVFFLLRILQCYNPVALWAFREYSIELEIDCDAEAVAGRNPKWLARALLKTYESTSHRDVAARSTLRRRVDILRGKTAAGQQLPAETVAAAALILLVLLPWIV